MAEHVEENKFSHLMDLTKEFGALKIQQSGHQAPKSRSRRTRGGVEAQEQASQEVLLTDFVNTVSRTANGNRWTKRPC